MEKQITINVTDYISPINQATIDLNGNTGNTYSKTQLDAKIADNLAAMQSSYLGVATTTTTPPATGAYWYRVDAPGTYMGVTVTAEDFKDANGNYFDVTIEVKDGVAVKKVREKPKGLDGKTIEVWSEKPFVSGSQTFHLEKIWESNTDTLATDIPGTSDKWVEVFSGGGEVIKQFAEGEIYNENEKVIKDDSLFVVKQGESVSGDIEASPYARKISGEIKLKKNTIAEIQEAVNFDAGTLAVVTGEQNPARNGIYRKVGSAGNGGWELTNFLNPLWSVNGNMSIGGGLQSVYVEEETPGSGTGNVTFGVNVGHNIGAGWANILFGYNVGSSLANKSVVNSWTKSLGNVGNIFFGYNIASAANGALDCSIFGNGAGQNMLNAMDNCFFGVWSGKFIEQGSENAFYGHLSGGYFIGKGDAENIDKTTQDPSSTEYSWGHRITAIGNLAGALDLGGNELNYGKKNVYIGSHTRGSNWAINENVFGYKAQGRGSNTVSIGNNEIKETHFHGILSNWTDRRFADLPTPNRALIGARSFILDANTRVFDAVVSGGGSNLMPVWCDGSSWRVG